MRIAFLNAKIRALCEDADFAKSQLGAVIAEELKINLISLMSASKILDLPQDNHRIIPNHPCSLYQIGIGDDLQLICTADHTKFFPKTSKGEVDWQMVNYIQIQKIKLVNGKQF